LEKVRVQSVTVLEGTRILRDNGGDTKRVQKELCYGNEEMSGDMEEAQRWWWYKSV
jgi:hypothetical protein